MYILCTLFAASYNKQIEFQPLVVLELRNRIDRPTEQDRALDLFCRRIVATQHTSCQIENKEQPIPVFDKQNWVVYVFFFSSIIHNRSNQKLRKTHVLKISETITGCPRFALILLFFFCCCVGFASIIILY